QSSKMSIEPSPDFKLFLELLPEDGSLPGETLENSSGGISQEEFYENHPELDGADEIKKRK
ncbi:MAG TPA: hypothetical protein VIE65_10825, partial [Methylobacter sp.]